MAREDTLHLDPFDASIPGQGMMDAPQGNQWERPAKIWRINGWFIYWCR